MRSVLGLCGCRWEEVADDLSGSVNVAKVDATAESATATRCPLHSPRRPAPLPPTAPSNPLTSPRHLLSVPPSVCRALFALPVSIAGFPTLLYVSRGQVWEYKGSRSREDLVRFATERQQRGGRVGREGGAEADGEEGSGRPVPPVPSAWAVSWAAFEGWSARLSDVLLGQTTVAAVLILMGVLLGVILTLLALALTLDQKPPPHYRPIPTTAAAKGAAADASKPVKGE